MTRRVAYVMSRFPKVTETFVLYEMIELMKLGFEVEVFPLLRATDTVQHPEAAEFVARARYQSLFSAAVLAANWHYLWRRPRRYLGTLLRAMAGTAGSARFFAGTLAYFPKAAWFAREMQRLEVQHVHAHFANHPALVAFVVHRLTGIPFSFTAHGSDIHVEQRSFDMKARAAAFAVTVSEYNKGFIEERFGKAVADKLHVIHCGIDPDSLQVRPDPGHDRLRIACVASLREVKGHRVLIEACRHLRDRGVPFSCHLVGDGPTRDAVRTQIAEAGLDDLVVMHGALPRPGVVEQLDACDVSVLPSILDRHGRREGIPVTLMEAMACGVPVVASRISGIPELVEHDVSGVLFPPGDAEALADALEALAGDPGRRSALGRAGRDRVVSAFNLRASTASLARLFENVCGAPASHAA